jgi:hypothetical protein
MVLIFKRKLVVHIEVGEEVAEDMEEEWKYSKREAKDG